MDVNQANHEYQSKINDFELIPINKKTLSIFGQKQPTASMIGLEVAGMRLTDIVQ